MSYSANKLLVVLAFAITNVLAGQAPAATPLQLSLNPARTCTGGRSGTYPNVDLLLQNSGPSEVQIDEIHGVVRDAAGQMIERRILWQQALNSLGPDRVLPPHSTRTIFNPFTFSNDVTGKSLTFEVVTVGDRAPIAVSTMPQSCANAYRMKLPLTGRVLVYDGFDALSHHRRGTYDDDWSKAMGIDDNFQRFGLDLVVIDAAGRYFRGDGSRTDQWLGWGHPVRASAAGTVAAVHDGQPDNVVIGTVDRWTDRPSRANPMSSYGNYVLIKHASGEYTLVGHLRNGSVLVKQGQRVAAGQQVGAMGNSGASGGVHTHFERRTGWGLAGIETLPAYVSDVVLVGAHPKGVISPGTGDVLIAH